MKQLGIYGAGGLAREVLELAKTINGVDYRWDGFLFVDLNASEEPLNGVEVVSEAYAACHKDDIEAVIAVGEPTTRNKIYNKVISDGIKLTNLIHPSIKISDTTAIGNGVIACAGVIITCNVEIADNVYIHSHAVVGHDIKIGRHSIIGANSVIGGANIFGERVFMGSLSGTLQGLTVGDDAEISAGAMVFRDIEPGMIVMGNPARVIRRNDGTGVFRKKGSME